MQEDKSLGERNYSQFADRYARMIDRKPHNAYYERPATLSLLPDVHRLRVLDAGCGPGVYAEWLVNHGAQVVAFDVTPQMVEFTRRRIGARLEALFVADLDKPLEFAETASFDLIVCPLVLDYIEDWQPVFVEFFRVLKPGGIFVYSAGHPASSWSYKLRDNYFDIELKEETWRSFGKPYPILKVYYRPLSAMINPLLEAGFLLDTLLEPMPTEEFRQAEPEDYEKLCVRPGFLCVRSRKPR